MKALEAAVEEYLRVRQALGFKLHGASRMLPQFVKFMARHKARYITTTLALDILT